MLRKDADGIVREDLLLTMGERLNAVTARLEELGLVILKDENGKYVTRGNRNLKINGENIKPIIAEATNSCPNVKVLNRVDIIDFAVKDNKVIGAYGIGIENDTSILLRQRLLLLPQVVHLVFINLTIRDFQDTKCGTHHLTQVPVMLWV